MRTFKKVGEGVLIAGFVFLFIVLLFQDRLQLPAFLKIAGRMHPMFLHFPIVLLLLSFLSLWIPSHEQAVWNWFDGLRLVAAISAVITAVMGLLLSLEEQELTRTLQWHKWGGVGIAFLSLIFYAWSNYFIKYRMFGKVFTVFGGLLIFITGHWGAGLTHGDNYLTEPMTANRIIELEDAVVFNDVIKPVLERKCITCHREANMKGGLTMESIAGVLKGGKTGPLFVPGKPDMSLLIHRIHLPLNEKKHMPPISKPALTDEEEQLLYAWIKSGALLKEKVVTLPVQDSFRMLAARSLSTDEHPGKEELYDFPPADNKLVSRLSNNYRVIKPLAAGAAALAVHFYGMANYSLKSLQELIPLKQQVTELSLARMPVKDEDLKTISQFTNLNKLNLNYTNISGEGLKALRPLKKLQLLSLSGTKVTASSLQPLDSMPSLSKLFIWDTPIDSVALLGLQSRYKKMNIEKGFTDNKEVMIALSPPALGVPPGVIDKKTVVELKHPIRNVEIRYTTDGTEPDSLKSAVYKKPFVVDSSITIKARAFKEGWYGSSRVEATYLMRKLKADSMELLTNADARYPLLSPDQLADADLGELNYNNGHWVGFHNNDAVIVLYFNQPAELNNVILNVLENTGAHIFEPVKIEVWGGMDKSGMKLLSVKRIGMPVKNEPSEMIQEKVGFASTTVKCLKIKLEKLKTLPAWHDSKGKPAWVMVSEIVLN